MCWPGLRRNLINRLREDAEFRVMRKRALTRAGNGIATAVTATATTVTITLPKTEDDANYGVVAVPNWGTTVFVTGKTTSQFVINFGTAAPASATVDWLTFRSE